MAIRHAYGSLPSLCVDTDIVHVPVALWNLWLDDGIVWNMLLPSLWNGLIYQYPFYFGSWLMTVWDMDMNGIFDWTQYRVQWVAFVNILMKLHIPWKQGIYYVINSQLYISLRVPGNKFMFITLVNHKWIRGESRDGHTCRLLRGL